VVSNAGTAELTARQQQVLELIASGCTNREIGDRLGISLDGAKWHVSEVLARLNLDTREEAADYWRRQNGLRTRLARVAKATGAAVSWKWLAAAGALTGVAAIAAIAVLVVLDGESAPPAAAPVSTAMATATPTHSPGPAVVPTTPGPVDDLSVSLTLTPASGNCSALTAVSFEGRGFNPNSTVVVTRSLGFDQATTVAVSPVEADGSFRVSDVDLSTAEDCHPGDTVVFTARSPGPVAGDPIASAVFTANQLGRFWIEPDAGGCGGIPVTIRGEGLPPNIPLRFAWGEAGPLPVHVFAQFNETATTDATGDFAVAVVLPVSCDPAEPQTGIYADSPELQARWKAVYTVTGP
jgi:DNA-binding CsgD family transcriptional regulator